MQLVKYFGNLRVLGKVLVTQELHAARWHLSPPRIDPLGQLSTSTAYVPKQQRTLPEGWVIVLLGGHMLFRLALLSHS